MKKNQYNTKINYINLKLVVLFLFVILLILGALFANSLTPYDPYRQDLSQALQAPSLTHLLGTDRFGRDILSRVILGGQTTIFSTLFLVMIIVIVGTMIGIISGYKGGKLDTFLMRISDVFLAFPGMVFAIAIAGVLSGGIINAVIALACIAWPKYARIVRSQVLVIKEEPYIAAAKLSGSTTGQIIIRHILPNILGVIIVTAVLDIGTMMLEIAGLSFLGLGATPPVPEWGAMMSSGRSMLQTAPWTIFAPGLAIFITVIIFNLLGDTLRDILDPHQDRKREERWLRHY